ncbi:MAG: hypothetical protein NVS2B17_00410 [Candidatus Velthaea sp.]
MQREAEGRIGGARERGFSDQDRGIELQERHGIEGAAAHNGQAEEEDGDQNAARKTGDGAGPKRHGLEKYSGHAGDVRSAAEAFRQEGHAAHMRRSSVG